MPEIHAMDNITWVRLRAKPYLRALYGKTSRFHYDSLPYFKVMPDHFVASKTHGVEVMIAILQSGAWLDGEDWRVFARYAIAKRLRVRLNSVFQEPFLELRDIVLDYQLNSGTFKTRNYIRKQSAAIRMHPRSTLYMQCAARLFLSVTDDVIDNTLIQPFHWVRTLVGLTDPNPVFSMSLFQSEMFRQKVTLLQMLRAPTPD